MKKLSLVLSTLLVLSLLYSTCALSKETIDPLSILDQAMAYAASKNYAKAMQNYVWFFNNATKINSSLSAIRLSTCLAEWRKLGSIYETALVEYRKYLNERKKRLENGEKDLWLYMEFYSFCDYDDKKNEAIDLFLFFNNQKNKKFAKSIFPLIKLDLLEMGYYNVCAEYIDTLVDSPHLFAILSQYYELDRESFNEEIVFLLSVLYKIDRLEDFNRLKGKINSQFELSEDLKRRIKQIK